MRRGAWHKPTNILIRGNPGSPGEKVEAGFPEVLTSAPVKITERDSKAPSSGKRLALAKWLTDRNNSVPARVMANRLWQYHFGRGIVPSSNDFGRLGEGADASGTARLAGLRVHGWRLEDQADAQAASDVQRLPDVSRSQHHWPQGRPMRIISIGASTCAASRLKKCAIRSSRSGQTEPEGGWATGLSVHSEGSIGRPIGAGLRTGASRRPKKRAGGASMYM